MESAEKVGEDLTTVFMQWDGSQGALLVLKGCLFDVVKMSGILRYQRVEHFEIAEKLDPDPQYFGKSSC